MATLILSILRLFFVENADDKWNNALNIKIMAITAKNKVLGVDIGGSGVKGAIVDIKKGEFASERVRIPTPVPATKEGLIAAIGEIIKTLNWKGKIGCGFPGIVKDQVIESAANLGDDVFRGTNLAEEIGRNFGNDAWIINDGDAAGLAELYFGAAKGRKGTVIMLTIGTGIGSAILFDGHLLPNSELGHIRVADPKKKGKAISAEKLYSDAARKKFEYGWKQWAVKFNEYIAYVERLFSPNLIVLGGGAAAKSDKYFKYLHSTCDIAIADLENKAGIIGAAYRAHQKL